MQAMSVSLRCGPKFSDIILILYLVMYAMPATLRRFSNIYIILLSSCKYREHIVI